MIKKLFWYSNMAGCSILWILSIIGIVLPVQNETLYLSCAAVLILFSILHPLELFISIPLGRSKSIPTWKVIVKTILFGFTWWLPLKMGILDH